MANVLVSRRDASVIDRIGEHMRPFFIYSKMASEANGRHTCSAIFFRFCYYFLTS